MITRIIYPILITVLTLLVAFFAWASFSKGFFDFGEAEVVSNHNIVLEKIEQMGKLELVKYKFRDVLEHKIEYKWWPDSKAILIISGEAIGCVDLEKIKEKDINNAGDTLYIRLPEPELCNYKINHEESRLYDTKSFSFDRANLVDQAFKAAEKQIERTALESNILEQARQNGEVLLRTIFEEIAQKPVIFTYALDTNQETIDKR